MKFLKTALIFSAMAAMLALTGCTACDSTSSSSSMDPSSSMPPSSAPASEFEGSVLPESEMEPSGSMNESSSSHTSSSMIPTLSTDFSEIGALSGEQVVWGPGRQVDSDNRPTACIDLQKKYAANNCWFIGDKKGEIYLTFDEGYENGYTAKILDVLKEKQVPAVFFVTMHYVKTNPDLIQRMIDEGHMVGNHSDKHPNYTTLPLDQIQKDLMSLHDYVKETHDYTMSVFRYPEGAFSDQTAALIGEVGYKQLFWSFAYKDWDPEEQPATDDARERIVNAAHDGAIYLLHAVSKANTEALPAAIDEIRAKGFEFEIFFEG